jgi:type I restriction enzyme S subunit
MEERADIITFIASRISRIDQVIQAAVDQIKLIREYRDRLISDVVTGQIDVRGWQPSGDETFEPDEFMRELAEAEELTEEEPGENHEGDEYQ